jgi:hypothetical protein
MVALYDQIPLLTLVVAIQLVLKCAEVLVSNNSVPQLVERKYLEFEILHLFVRGNLVQIMNHARMLIIYRFLVENLEHVFLGSLN